MNECVVDASALIDAVTVKGSSVTALRARLLTLHCHAPHLVDAELGSVLRKKVRLNELTADQALGLLRAGSGMVDERYPHGPLSATAWELRDNLSYYDALYAALAARLDVPLLTTDKRLAHAPKLPCAVEIVLPS